MQQTPAQTPASILVQKPRKRVSFATDTSDGEFDATCAQPQRPASCPVRTLEKWEQPIDVGVQACAETRKHATIEAAGILMSFADELTDDVASEMRTLLAAVAPSAPASIRRNIATGITDN